MLALDIGTPHLIWKWIIYAKDSEMEAKFLPHFGVGDMIIA